MLLFRSEEHVAAWVRAGHPNGAALSLDQQWDLAVAWFTGRDLPSWRMRTAAEAEEVFRSAGLTDEFWRLC